MSLNWLENQLRKIPPRVLQVGSIVLTLASLAFLLAALAVSGDPSWASPTIALGSVIVALNAWSQSRRSADAAQKNAHISELQEGRRRYGWVLEPHPDPNRHVLRNTGTLAATQVQLTNTQDFAHLAFLRQDDGAPTIQPGEAKAFDALESFGSLGVEVTISWIPEGEAEKKEWVEVLESAPDTKIEKIAAERAQRNIREEQRAYDEFKEIRQILLQLGQAYAEYKTDPENMTKKFRVQMLTSALPPDLAREVGYEVDVPRHVWGPDEYPLDQMIADEDKHILQGNIPQVELMWNLFQLRGLEIWGPVGRGRSQELRVWHAMQGYVDRVKERESGERTTRRSPADQKHYNESMEHIRQFQNRMNSRQQESESSPQTTETSPEE